MTVPTVTGTDNFQVVEEERNTRVRKTGHRLFVGNRYLPPVQVFLSGTLGQEGGGLNILSKSFVPY